MSKSPNIEKLQKKKDIKKLINILTKDSDFDHRYKAAEALGSIGDSAAVQPLTKALNDSFWEVRCYAAVALGKIRNPNAVEPLITALKYDENKRARRWDIVEGSVINTNDSGARRSAARALGMIGDKKAIPALYEALKDRNNLLRMDVIKSLKQLGSMPEVEQILQINFDIMADSEERVRDDAAEQLLEIGEVAGLRLVLKALIDSNKNRFMAATWTIMYSHKMESVIETAGEEEFNRQIKECMPYLIKRLNETEIIEDAQYDGKIYKGLFGLPFEGNMLLQFMKIYGDESVIPALESLLEKMRALREKIGYQRYYVVNNSHPSGGIAGWQDNDISWLEKIVVEIKKRFGKG